MRRHLVRALPLASLVLVPCATVGAAQENIQAGQRFTVSQQRLDIYDAVGHVTLHHGTGSDIVIVATRVGADAGRIGFAFDRESDRGVYRVVFPVSDIERIADPDGDGGGRTTLRLRADGTFGGDGERGGSFIRRAARAGRGEEIEVGGRGGFRGSANLDITVPDGKVLKVHVVAGGVRAEGVNGDVLVDTWGADAAASDIAEIGRAHV